jgi:large repetitive protein
MVRWLKFLKLSFPLFALLSVLIGRTAYAHGAASPLHQGRVEAHRNAALYPTVDAQWLGPDFAAVAEFTFQSNARFDLRGLKVALNGKEAQTAGLDPSSFARWDLRQGQWVLVIEVGKLSFDHKRFSTRVKEIQALSRRMEIGLSVCARAKATHVYFTRAPSTLPRVQWVGQLPGTWVRESSVAFQFTSQEPSARFECRKDDGEYLACQSGVVWSDLRNGSHTFSVRAVTLDGKKGPALAASFWVWVIPLAVEITRVVPSENPTPSTSIAFDFRTRWTFGYSTYFECSLDKEPFRSCPSGVGYLRLASGDHAFEVRIAKRFWGWKWVSRPTQYRWTISNEPLRFYWVSTSEATGNRSEAIFEFGSNRKVFTECALDGVSITPCESPLALRSLKDGEHHLVVNAKESASTAVAATLEHRWFVDATPPTLSITSVAPAASPTNQSTFALEFSASEPVRLSCQWDGAAFAPCASPIRLDQVSEGSHRLEVVAIDGAGNQSVPLVHEWVVDTSLPEVKLVRAVPERSLSNADTARFEWVLEAGTTYQCQWDGFAAEACTSPVTLSSVGEGTHRFSVWGTDAAGNVSEPVSSEWSVDFEAPVVELISVIPSEPITESRVFQADFRVSSDAQATCELDASGTLPCVSPFQANQLAEGFHSLVIRAKDGAGNEAAPVSYRWRVAPRALVQWATTEFPAVQTASRAASFVFTGENAAYFECALDSNAFSQCQSPADYQGLSDGSHRFVVRAVNGAGIAGTSLQYDWTVDLIAPVITLQSADPSGSITSRNRMVLQFAADESATFMCKLDGEPETVCSSPATWENLQDGFHSVSITAQDAVGNTSAPFVYAWRVITAPLQVVSVSVQGLTRSSAVIRWSTNFPATGRVEYGIGSPSGNTSAQSNEGTLIAMPLTGLQADTAYQARVIVTDQDGRTSVSAPLSFSTLR